MSAFSPTIIGRKGYEHSTRKTLIINFRIICGLSKAATNQPNCILHIKFCTWVPIEKDEIIQIIKFDLQSLIAS